MNSASGFCKGGDSDAKVRFVSKNSSLFAHFLFAKHSAVQQRFPHFIFYIW